MPDWRSSTRNAPGATKRTIAISEARLMVSRRETQRAKGAKKGCLVSQPRDFASSFERCLNHRLEGVPRLFHHRDWSGHFDKHVSFVALDNRALEHALGLWRAWSAWHTTEIGPFHLDISHPVLAHFRLFHFGIVLILELAHPAVDVRFGAAPVSLTKVKKHHLGALALVRARDLQLGLAHRRGHGHPIPISRTGEREFSDLEVL